MKEEVFGWKGDYPANSKINARQVHKIKKLYATGKYHKKSKTLAKRFELTPDSIYRIVSGRRWKMVA